MWIYSPLYSRWMYEGDKINQAERELALATNPGPESDRDIRLADWALWWGPRLLEAIRHKEPQIDPRPNPMP